MGDPDIVNAFLGATVGSGVVGPILEKLIEGFKYVSHCKAECLALREELKIMKPMLERISDMHKVDTTLRSWLTDLEKCVVRAVEILAACKSDNSRVWDRVREVRYGAEILELKERIRVGLSLAPMALLSLQSGTSRSNCGIMQEVPKKILGMEDHLKRVKSLVLEGHETDDSSCVSIRGMGGAGKTLLAQMVNNDGDIQRVFGMDCVIWITCGRNADILVLYDRMRKCLGVHSEGGCMEDQRTELLNAFLKKRVLLILDDVWDVVLHNYEMLHWLNIAMGPGSVMLVTTRDESITRKCITLGEEIILQLSEKQSWELFCTHAFGIDTPMLDMETRGVVMDVCKECKCLPLALKVLGRAMRGKRGIHEWKVMLRHLRASSMIDKSVQDQLFGRLRLSYDELSEVQKICFLYFGAFAEDCEVRVECLCEILVAEGLFEEDLDVVDALEEARGVVNELLDRSLIEWGGDCNDGIQCKVKMHDILRDIAIQITSEGSECERESLFQLAKMNVEEFPKAWLGSTMKVKRLSVWGNKMKKFPSDFIAPNLKICLLHPNLWSEWKFLTRESRFHGFKLEEEFFGNLLPLRCLWICENPYLLELPECMGGLVSLQHLCLSYCLALKQLPESMGGLGSLQHLNLLCCGALEQLPENMGGLRSLQHLNLLGCCALEQLPQNMGGLGSLQHLDLSFCHALKQLPQSMGELGSLQHLNLSCCSALKQLPESMGGLGSLQHLDLSGCWIFEQLPESMGGLRSLQRLNLSYCSALKKLPESMGGLGSLQHLNLLGCCSLKQLPESMGGLGSLQHLNLSYCGALEELPERMGGLGSLQHLDLLQCRALEQLPESLGGLRSLQHLDLRHCKMSICFPSHMSMDHLKILY